MTADPRIDLFEAPLTRQQRQIVNILVRCYPDKVARDDLISELFDHREDGGPEHGFTSLRVQIMNVRRALEPYGWTIPRLKLGNMPGSNGRNGVERPKYLVAYGLARADSAE